MSTRGKKKAREGLLIRRSSPHIRSGITGRGIMMMVLIALAPAVASGFYYFGRNAIALFMVTIASTFVFDLAYQIISGSEKKDWFYASSYVTSILLYLTLPPTAPLWIPMAGVAVALGIGKYVFGLGNSVFNPALVGRAFLVISFPVLMTSWVWPDGITGATPLALAKAGGIQAAAEKMGGLSGMYSSMAFGNIAGCIGETSALALLLGGLFLVLVKVIDWRVPAAYIGGVAALNYLTGGDALFSILGGGLMLGAIFMATDYGTTPLTLKGRIIFALGCAVLTFLFRSYSSMSEGVMYSILLMNSVTPLIDRWVRPKIFGAKRRWKR